LLAQGTDIVPIPRTTNLARLEENLAAPQVTLSKKELQRIETVAPHGVAAGQRYQPASMQLLNR
jgi:diketogulonate reductase-like aldo/keto reductase